MRHLLLKLFRRRRLQSDLETELAFHNEMAAANGNPIRLGNQAVIKENAFDLWRFNGIENIWRDMAYAVRSLSRSPGFVLSALLSLGLGIGVNTAMFSIAVEFLLSEPSVVDARSWVSIRMGGSSHSKPEVEQFLHDSGVFQEVVGENFLTPINWDDGHDTRSILSVQTTKNYFAALQVPLALGRGWTVNDSGAVVVLRHQFWQDRFGGDPSIVGRAINLDGRAFTVLGVLPESSRTLVGFGVSPDVYLPSYLPETLFQIYARLKPGMSLGQARVAAHALAARLDLSLPDPDGKYVDGLQVTPFAGVARLQDGKDGTLLGIFSVVLLTVAGMVFLIACLNVANLLLVRSSTRKQEFAIRLSLGASRGRLLQQMMAESLLLSVCGAGAGFALAEFVAKSLASIQLPIPVPLHLQIDPDWRVITYAAVLGAAATIICGLLPAWHSVRESLAARLQRERRLRMRRWLVTVQIAVSVIVLSTGSLFLRNLLLANAISPGFDVRSTIRADVHLPPERYRDQAVQRAYFDRALRQLAAIPGIEAAAAASIIPFTDGSNYRSDMTFPQTGQKREVEFHWNAVSPAYFDAMGIPVLGGRAFTAEDRGGAPRVVMVNKNFVQRYLNGQNAVGVVFTWGPAKSLYQIVGVVAGTKNLTIGEPDQAQLYESLAQVDNDHPHIQFVLRSSTPPATQMTAVRRVLRQVDPASGVDVNTMYASIGLAFLPSQVGAALLGSIGVLGLLLAAIGLYGVTAYSVARRTREIGVRIAVGASKSNIMRLVLAESASLLLTGSGVGLLIAFFITKPLAMFLVAGLSPADPLTFASVVLFLALTGIIATIGPMRRAVQVDPVTSLRYE